VTRTPVQSSNIASIGYDQETGVMEVEFKGSGKVYTYPNVSAHEHETLIAAPSIGKKFNELFGKKSTE
jgi:hypothetical protein